MLTEVVPNAAATPTSAPGKFPLKDALRGTALRTGVPAFQWPRLSSQLPWVEAGSQWKWLLGGSLMAIQEPRREATLPLEVLGQIGLFWNLGSCFGMLV